MKKVLKFIITTGMVLAMTAAAAFAQSSYSASAETIRDDVDYSTNYMYYKNAKVNDYIVSGNISTNELNVGFGKQFTNAYWGLSYNGNLWGYNKTIKTSNNDTSTTTKEAYNCYNNFETFIGLRNFSLGTSFNFSNKKNEDLKEINPALFVSGDIDLITMLIKPYLRFDYNYTEKENANSEANNFKIKLGTDLVNDMGDSISILNIDYNIDFGTQKKYTSYNDKYNGAYKPVNNELTVDYKFNKNLNPRLILGTDISVSNRFEYAKYLDKDDNEYKSVFSYKLTPIVSFGIKYDLIPSKLSLLLGDEMTVFPLTVTTNTNKNPSVKTTTTETKTFSSKLTCGLNWNINRNTTLDFDSVLPADYNSTLGDMQFGIGLSYRK